MADIPWYTYSQWGLSSNLSLGGHHFVSNGDIPSNMTTCHELRHGSLGGTGSMQGVAKMVCPTYGYGSIYLLIPFLGGWTSIYQLFWCSPGVQGFDTLPYGYGSKTGPHQCSGSISDLVLGKFANVFGRELILATSIQTFWDRLRTGGHASFAEGSFLILGMGARCNSMGQEGCRCGLDGYDISVYIYINKHM